MRVRIRQIKAALVFAFFGALLAYLFAQAIIQRLG
jgi:hypothetical protein